MSLYEILYIIPAKFSEEELQPIIDKVTSLIKKGGGETIFTNNLGKKKLGYPIKQIKQGYYILEEFKLKPSALKKLKADLKLLPEVLKHIILKIKISSQEKPSLRPISVEKKRGKIKIEKEEKKKVSLEDLDERLDKILEDDMIK